VPRRHAEASHPLFVSHALSPSITFQRSRQNQQQHYWVDKEGVLPPREYYSLGISTTVRTVYQSYSLRVYTRKYLRRLRGPTCSGTTANDHPRSDGYPHVRVTHLSAAYTLHNGREGKVRRRHLGGETSTLPLRKCSPEPLPLRLVLRLSPAWSHGHPLMLLSG